MVATEPFRADEGPHGDNGGRLAIDRTLRVVTNGLEHPFQPAKCEVDA